MNVIQFTPRMPDDAGMFEPLRSLAGLRPGDSIEQTGRHAARLVIELSPEPDAVDLTRDGRTLLVVGRSEARDSILRRFDLADGVNVTSTRRTRSGFEIDFVKDQIQRSQVRRDFPAAG